MKDQNKSARHDHSQHDHDGSQGHGHMHGNDERHDSHGHDERRDSHGRRGGWEDLSPADGLAGKTVRLGQLLSRYYAVSSRAQGRIGEPGRGQGRLLLLLKDREGLSQREIAYLLGMSPQGVSELVSKLEAKGLVERTRSEEDARKMLVSLTEAGSVSMPELAEDAIADPFDCLSDEEREGYEQALSKVEEQTAQALEVYGFVPHGRRGGCRGMEVDGCRRGSRHGRGFDDDGDGAGEGRCRHGHGCHGHGGQEGGRPHEDVDVDIEAVEAEAE